MVDNGNISGNVIKSVRREKGVIFVEVTGDIDLYRSVELRENLLTLVAEKPKATIINMSEVGFMDSSGLATLVETLQLSRRDGGELKLVGVQDRVRSIFEISRLDSIFQIFDSEAEAMA